MRFLRWLGGLFAPSQVTMTTDPHAERPGPRTCACCGETLQAGQGCDDPYCQDFAAEAAELEDGIR